VKKNYIKAIGKGILKVMSKMGISTYQSYCGAQIFDAIGLSGAYQRYFTGTATIIEGCPRKSRKKPCVATPAPWRQPDLQEHARCGRHLWLSPARRGARWTPANVASLQHAVRGNVLKSTGICPSINRSRAT
jgi:glutamate synthase (NADPH/NADH) large chain